VLLAPSSPAQIQGTPPSVTSFGFGGNFNPAPGVPASVTSLGPNGFGNGFNCCFRPGFSNHPQHFRDHQVRDHERFPIGLSMPVYVPYAVPYPVYAEAETDDDDSVPGDTTYRRGVPPVYDRGYQDAPKPRQVPHDPTPRAAAPEDPEPPGPVVAPQPTTVLVFKDGHKTEVQNYAIVNGTLFDFTDGRSRKIPLADLDLPATEKANDDLGVDFQVPAKSAQNKPEKVKS
jgi:hypothetical protein